jgi:hypothetical protein
VAARAFAFSLRGQFSLLILFSPLPAASSLSGHSRHLRYPAAAGCFSFSSLCPSLAYSGSDSSQRQSRPCALAWLRINVIFAAIKIIMMREI